MQAALGGCEALGGIHSVDVVPADVLLMDVLLMDMLLMDMVSSGRQTMPRR